MEGRGSHDEGLPHCCEVPSIDHLREPKQRDHSGWERHEVSDDAGLHRYHLNKKLPRAKTDESRLGSCRRSSRIRSNNHSMRDLRLVVVRFIFAMRLFLSLFCQGRE